MNDAHYLIIRKQRLADQELAAHVERLAPRLEVDAYNLRLALRGDGLSSLRYGDPEKLRELAQELTPLGYQWCIVDMRRMEAEEPLEVRRFDRQTNSLGFEGRFGRRELRRGQAVAAVLAATEGDMVGKLLRKSTFRGGAAATLDDGEKLRTILCQTPVLDLYLLADHGGANEGPVALRVLPGRFDVATIGGDPLGGAKQNFTHVLDEVRRLAGRFDLDLDFGFSQLPGGGFDSSTSPDAAERNRRSAARYGRCVVELLRQSPTKPKPAVLAGATPLDRLGAAGLAAGGPAGVAVGAAALALNAAFGLRGAPAAPLPATAEESGLPPPPPSVREGWAGDWRVWPALVYFGGYLLLGMLAAFSKASSGALAERLFTYGFRHGLFFFAAAGLLFYHGFGFLRLRRLMADTPTSKARSAAVGMVEMAGHCERACSLVSPLSQIPCVYYRLTRFTRRKGRYGENQWQRVGAINSGPAPFYLRDETGRALVNPAGAKIRAGQSRTIQEGSNTLFAPMLPVSPDERYVEEVIAEGTLVYVLGFASPFQQERLSLRARVAEKLRLLKADRPRMMQYDANRDGRIDQLEWERARADAERAATADTLADGAQAARSEENIVIAKPPLRGLPFVVSETTEKRLSATYAWITVGLLAAAVALAAVGTAALLA